MRTEQLLVPTPSALEDADRCEATWTLLCLSQEETPRPWCPGILFKSPRCPSRLQTSGGRSSANPPAGPSARLTACIPHLHQGREGQVCRQTGGGSLVKDRGLGVADRSEWDSREVGCPFCILGSCVSPPTGKGLLCQLTDGGVRRFPACQLLWLLQKCGPEQPSLNPLGTEGTRGHKPSTVPQAMLVALSPRHSDDPPCHSQRTKKQPC